MKKFSIVFGVFLLIGLVLAGCSNPTGGGGSNGTTTGGGGGTAGWPSADILAKYGIAGLTEPANLTSSSYTDGPLGILLLVVDFSGGGAATRNHITDYFADAANGWSAVIDSETSQANGVYQWIKDKPYTVVDFKDFGDGSFQLAEAVGG